MKKRTSLIVTFLAFILCLGFLSTGYDFITKRNDSHAFAFDKGAQIQEEGVCSKSSILRDAETGTIIQERNADEKLPIASMCKIMTLLLVFEKVDAGEVSLSDTVCVSANASGMGGSQVFLETNGNYTVSELIKSVVVASANDASVALAEHCYGSEEQFVSKMNERASELGMNNTVFVNCTGLPKVGQFSCARDVSVMFSELITHKKYFDYSKIWTDKVEHGEGRITEISNTNKLVRFYNGCDGGKTGYTHEAGHCLTATAQRNGTRLISVVISAPDGKTRFKETSEMFNYGFANYCNKLIINSADVLNEKAVVSKSDKNEIAVKPQKDVFAFGKIGEKHEYEIVTSFNENLTAPIIKGEIVGKISVYEKGVEIYSTNVIADENADALSYGKALEKIGRNWSTVK